MKSQLLRLLRVHVVASYAVMGLAAIWLTVMEPQLNYFQLALSCVAAPIILPWAMAEAWAHTLPTSGRFEWENVFWSAAYVLTMFIAFQYPRRRWAPEGLCRVCGYDLRATPERCPECGTLAPAD